MTKRQKKIKDLVIIISIIHRPLGRDGRPVEWSQPGIRGRTARKDRAAEQGAGGGVGERRGVSLRSSPPARAGARPVPAGPRAQPQHSTAAACKEHVLLRHAGLGHAASASGVGVSLTVSTCEVRSRARQAAGRPVRRARSSGRDETRRAACARGHVGSMIRGPGYSSLLFPQPYRTSSPVRQSPHRAHESFSRRGMRDAKVSMGSGRQASSVAVAPPARHHSTIQSRSAERKKGATSAAGAREGHW